MHDCMYAIASRKGGEAEVRDDEPLRRECIVVLAVRRRRGGVALPGPRGDDVDARLELADRLEDREVGRHVLIELGSDVHRAAPDLQTVRTGDLARARPINLLEEIIALNRRREIAVADPVDVDRDLGGVDRDQRRALLALARQHVALAGEMNLG